MQFYEPRRGELEENLTKLGVKPINLEAEDKGISPTLPISGVITDAIGGLLNFGNKSYKDELKNAKTADDVVSGVNNALSKLDANQGFLFKNEKDADERTQYIRSMSDILKQTGRGRLVYDKDTNEDFYEDEKGALHPLDDGIINKFGRIIRDNAYSLVGSALSVKKGGGFMNNMARGAVGSGTGGVLDATAGAEYLDKSMTAGDALRKFGEEALLSGAGDVVLGGAAKIAKPTLNVSGKFVGKALDLMPIVRALRDQNIGGALKELENQVGGKEALDAIRKQADELGTKVDIEDGSYLAGVAKDELGQVGKKLDELEVERQLLQKGKEKAKEAIEKSDGLIDKVQNLFFKSDDITKGQSDILTGARANERVAQIAGEALASNPVAANKMNQIITTDTNKILDDLAGLQEGKATTRDTALAYQQRVKDEFKEGLSALEQAHQGIKTTIPENESGRQFLAEINALKDSVWGGMPNAKLKNIISDLESKRQIDIGGVNELRTELNRLISSSNDNNVKYIANNVKRYVESDVLDNILSKTPFNNEARALYKKMVSEYRDMMNVSDSKWFGQILNNDIGEENINKSIAKVLNEKAPNNSVDLFLGKLSDKEAAGVELNLINKAVNDAMATMANNGKVIDIKQTITALEGHNFRSADAKNFVNLLKRLEPIMGQDITLAKAIGAFRKGEKLNQGISSNPFARIHTMLANRTIKTALRLVPIIGRQPALIHHVEQAILKSKHYDGFMNSLEKVAASGNTPQNIRTELNAFLKAQHDTNIAELKGEKLQNKEKRGIYNVTYNSKNSTKIKKYDLDILKDFIKYERGNESKGAIHIRKHLKNGSVGEVSTEEILEMGEVVRKGKKHIEDGRKVFTLYKDDGTRLRVVVGDKGKTQKVITFYSDRNIKR